MRYRFEPAIFASAPLDKRDWRWHLTSAFSQRLRKYTFTAVHTKTHRRRFQIYPLWRAFSNLCVYGERFHRLRVDGRPKRIKKFAFTSVCVYNRLRVDGAPKSIATLSQYSVTTVLSSSNHHVFFMYTFLALISVAFSVYFRPLYVTHSFSWMEWRWMNGCSRKQNSTIW